MTVDELIATEVNMYVQYCRLAAKHDNKESKYKQQAHNLFYHIQELRSTGKIYMAPEIYTDFSYSIKAIKGEDNDRSVK